MPLYEYECDACGHRFEQIRKFSDPPIEICPKCGGHVHKLMSSPAIQFKGSGWYITDYAKKDGARKDGGSSEKSAKSDKTEGASSSKGEGASESKSDAKSDASSETKTKSEKKGDAAKP